MGSIDTSLLRFAGQTGSPEENVMSEQQRTRLYAWLREQTDEPLAEYLMACLAPAPLTDLVTKDYLTAELSRFATKDEMNTGFAALRAEMASQRTEDRAEFATQRAEDRSAARQRHYWLTGTVVAVGAPIWLNTLGIIG
ncbi:MAG: hypothetical protein OXH86_20025 [Acidimicrobiaceae bacterium]|nr:hypothetical protein [Acidimicrobiaceae bacterium]